MVQAEKVVNAALLKLLFSNTPVAKAGMNDVSGDMAASPTVDTLTPPRPVNTAASSTTSPVNTKQLTNHYSNSLVSSTTTVASKGGLDSPGDAELRGRASRGAAPATQKDAARAAAGQDRGDISSADDHPIGRPTATGCGAPPLARRLLPSVGHGTVHAGGAASTIRDSIKDAGNLETPDALSSKFSKRGDLSAAGGTVVPTPHPVPLPNLQQQALLRHKQKQANFLKTHQASTQHSGAPAMWPEIEGRHPGLPQQAYRDPVQRSTHNLANLTSANLGAWHGPNLQPPHSNLPSELELESAQPAAKAAAEGAAQHLRAPASTASTAAITATTAAAADALPEPPLPDLKLLQCPLLNASICSATMHSTHRGGGFLLVAYNPLAQRRRELVQVPVALGPLKFEVTGEG